MKTKVITKKVLFLLGALTMGSTFVPHGPVHAATTPTITLDANTNAASVSPHLFGANDRFFSNGVGKYDPVNQQVYPDFVTSYNEIGFKTMRYPAGTAANLYWWQRAVGNGNNTNPDSGLDQIHGKTLAPEPTNFNLDKALQFTESTGTMLTYMYNMGNGNPSDAANLVQYLNGTDASNPYVQLRMSNGHPAPYHITYFEIGNETGPGQLYWLDGNRGGHSEQDFYVNGGTVKYWMQPVVLKTDWRSIKKDYGGNYISSYKSTGVSGQQVYAAYGPVTTGSDILYVNGTAWTRVSSFTGYNSTDPVYQMDNASGLITFGDGTNGMIPPTNATIAVTYSAYHSGYKDYITAMKAVDPSIKVLSNLHDDATIAALNAAHVQYDGMSIHEYTTGGTNISLTDYFAQVMGSAASKANEVKSLQQKLKDNPLSGGIVFPSEFGLNGNPTGYPNFQISLGEALYTAKMQMSFMQMGLPVATKHALIDKWGGSNSVGAGNFAMINNNYTPGSPYNFSKDVTAYMYQMLINMSGTTALSAPSITDMPVYGTSNQNAISAVATKNANGDLYLVVMNEDPSNDYTTNVNIANYQTGGTATVWKLGEGSSLDQFNATDQAPSIVNQTSTVSIPGNAFTYTFPAHTLTAIKLTGTVTEPQALDAAHYQLNESTGSTAADIGGHYHTATLVATSGGTLNWDPNSTTGIKGVLHYVPTGSNTYGNYYVSVPNFLDPAASDFTMSAWVNLAQESTPGSNQTIFAQEGSTGRNILYREAGTGKLKSYLGGVTTTSTSVIPTGEWTHVALVKSGGTITLYINGAADTTAAVAAESSTGNFRIGAHKAPTNGNANWNGAMDEVQIVNAALTSAQIQNMANKLSPLAYYQLNESTGTAAADVTGNTYTGTLVANSGGTLGWNPTGGINNSGALEIAPTGSNTYGNYYVSIPNLFNPAATDFTLTAWVKLAASTGVGSTQTIFAQEGSTGRNMLYRDASTGRLNSFLGGVTITSAKAITTGEWTHVALVKSGGTITLYINGAVDATAAATPESSTGNFRIGAHKTPNTGNANWNGAMDEVQIFNQALTPASVQNIYKGMTP
ncbi:LamG-like jellyroll fold domain-containing protein [Paenibacillus oryzisoli]|uniref:LamG-like jellyroll fold domain-containing protein n=1 Tax=Paenibacillus oryzisoli TaxID=1850517 RepID=UPI003D2BFC83